MWLALLLLGCPGKPPPDDTADTGDSAHTGDTGHSEDSGESGHSEDTDETGETGESGETGETGDTEDTGPPPPACEETTLLPCEAGACTWDLDLAVHTLTGTATLDGAAFAGGYLLTATEVDRADVVSVEVQDGGAWRLDLAPGTWHLDLAPLDGSMPAGRVAEALVVEGDLPLDLAVAAHHLGGGVTWNGGPVPDTSGRTDRDYSLTATEVETGASQSVSFRHDEAWELWLPDGTWDLDWRALEIEDGDAVTPLAVRVAEDLVVDADRELDLDIQAFVVGGAVTVDGGRPPNTSGSTTKDFRVTLRELDTGATAAAPFRYDQDWAMWVPLGRYELRWQADYVGDADDAPRLDTVVVPELVVAAAADVPLAVQSAVLGGTVRHDGALPPDTSGYTSVDYAVTVVDRQSGRSVTDTFRWDAPWSFRLPLGDFDVWWQAYGVQPEDDVTTAAARALRGVHLEADLERELVVETAVVGGAVTYGGGLPPDTSGSPDEDYLVTAVEVHTGAIASAAFRWDEPWALRLPLGTWNLSWVSSGGTEGEDLMVIEAPAVDWFVLAEDTALDLDVTPVPVDGAVLLDGAAPPDTSATDLADYKIIATELDHGVATSNVFRWDQPWHLVLFPGAWSLSWEAYGALDGDPAPRARFPAGECVEIPG